MILKNGLSNSIIFILYLYCFFIGDKIGGPMEFARVAEDFQAIEKTSSRTEITLILANLFKRLTPEELSYVCNLTLGQLHPPYISTQFNIANKTMVRIIADILEVPIETIEKQLKEVGDVGDLLAKHPWYKTKSARSVTEVYQALVEIEKMSGTGSQEQKAEALKQLLLSLTVDEAKYVVRIILGKLRLGFSDMTIVDALSWMETGDKSLRTSIENAYNICADIGLIGSMLKKEGIESLKNMHIHVGVPIRPAAAERLPTAKAIVEKLGHCVAQPKLDGFRLQIHVDKTGELPKIHFYSRNLIDMSNMFPDLLEAFRALPVDTLVCEGEAISYDPQTGTFLKFQETVKRKRKHGIEEAIVEYPLKVFLFDVLYINGQELLSKTHAERRAVLQKITQNIDNTIVSVIDEKEINNVQDLEEYFIENIASGLEGLVVKRIDSIYQPGKRNFNWIKLKRQEEGHLEDTIDSVVLGYYAGQGKRSSFGIGALLVGVYNHTRDVFQTVAKIGTGLTDEGWRDIKKRCDNYKVDEQPKNVECAKQLIPDVWVNPEIVCSIRADEITLSPLHTAGKTETMLGYALRFPRFMGYREDKNAYDATTDQEMKRLYEDQFIR